MIRILLVDDHPAMRAGLTAVLRSEPGMVVLGEVPSADELAAALARTHPDVVLLDYHLPRTDGLVLCRRIKRAVPAPAVLLYSAYADASLVIPSILAGADGLLNKSIPAQDLYDAVRRVARGDKVLPPVPGELIEAAGAEVHEEDLPILGMMLDGTPLDQIATTMRIDGHELNDRVERMLGRLRIELPVPPR